VKHDPFGSVPLNVVRLSVLFISAGAAVCALLIGSGCAEHGKTLVDAVQATTGERIALVEKLDVSSDNGLLGAEDMRGAKVVRRVDRPASLATLGAIVANVVPGRRNVSHPVGLGECILRVKIARSVFYVFCELEETEKGRYGIIWMGSSGETNRNLMTRYESDAIPDWLDENGLLAGRSGPIRGEMADPKTAGLDS